jgi:hypothetical protein
MNEQRYKTLKAGDERRKGDEVRLVDVSKGVIHCGGKMVNYFDSFPNQRVDHTVKRPKPVLGEFEPVQLIGHKILVSDLMVAEFRRPLL